MSDVSERVLYRDIVPYETPSSLGALRGPAAGKLELPITVNWGPKSTYDLDVRVQARCAYQQIVGEGSATQQEALLDADLLQQLWSDLVLPIRCQAAWQTRFPQLTEQG